VPGKLPVHGYAGPGIGFLADGDSQLVLNLLAGARYDAGPGSVFLEFGSQDLGNNSRLQAGYRIGL
jgi:hypothetical protein